MEYFKSLKSVLGAPQDDQQPTAAETIEKLVDRVQTSTLLDDRRDACRALKALSNKFRLEIGAQAMDSLIRVLECDRSDNEILGYALEAISNVITPRPDEIQDAIAMSEDSLGLQFTEIFIKKPENVTLLLELIEEYDFKVRWPIVKLLVGLLQHKPKDLQECILVSPMGVSRLMDLLSDTREIIRNETLLLLELLTKSNANIQKIVAFENAFDILLRIISEEGFSDGGVVVGDCLRVMLTLLKNNTSNQTFFKEGSYIKHLAPFFDLQELCEKGWSEQKAINTLTMLMIIRVLVSPNNPQQVTATAQKAMFQCGLLEQLCPILMASGVPADVLTESINTVADLIRGNHSNQEYFASVCVPTTPPRPAIAILLLCMVNDKQPFHLRCAVLYCFQCFLYRNEFGQAQIVQTLLPSTADVPATETVGHLLCSGLFSMDTLSKWFAAVALSHALVDNPTQKEQLLRVQLATRMGSPAISLMNQCSQMLQQGGKLQTRLGLLMLMSTWLANCTVAVMQFLSVPTNIPFLTSQVNLEEGNEHEDLVQGICAFVLGICIEFNDNSQPSFTKEDLCQLIVKRIGLETFIDKLVAITKSEHYSRAAQNPHLKFMQSSDVLFDYEFCRLFKSLEGVIIKAVQPKPKLLNGPESSMTPEQQELLRQYKDFIRDQDIQIKDLKNQIEEMKTEYENSKTQVEDMTSTIQQLKDQNALLKVQRSVSGNNCSQEVLQLRQEIEQLKLERQAKQLELDSKIKEGDQKVFESSGTNTNSEDQIVKELHNQVELGKKENEKLREEINQKNIQIQTLQKNLDETVRQLQNEKSILEEQLNKIRTDQEEMLIMLTDQSDKIEEYKNRLRELGEQVDDNDDDGTNSEDLEVLNDLNDDMLEDNLKTD